MSPGVSYGAGGDLGRPSDVAVGIYLVNTPGVVAWCTHVTTDAAREQAALFLLWILKSDAPIVHPGSVVTGNIKPSRISLMPLLLLVFEVPEGWGSCFPSHLPAQTPRPCSF